MCGINGIFAYHDAASAPRVSELLATRDAMTARGPDGAGEWWSDNRRMGLGHRRLSILDLSSRAGQPMISEDGRYVVVFNGEIYNAPFLREELRADGHHFRTTSDTEVILQLYARRGSGCVSSLLGMYAFGIWDVVAETLFLARDPYGIKPLYYANDGWTFRFASQVKSLLAGGMISRDIEPAGLVGFHLWGHIPEPFTLHGAIRALPAGHTMTVGRLGPQLPVSYWSMASVLACAHLAPSALERGRVIREGVRASVARHLLADVDVGVFLSAGIDSGAILGLVRDAGVARPKAITLSFEEFRGTQEDEAPLASEVAHQYDAEHVRRVVGEAEFKRDLPAIFDAMDQPSIDGVNTWFVAKAAREAGLKVALSGLGGDELLAGYPSFKDLPVWRRRYGILAHIPGLGALARSLTKTLAPDAISRNPKAAYVLDHAGSWEGAYLLRRGLFMPGELSGVIDPDLLREGLRRLAPLKRLRATLTPDPGGDRGRVSALESCHYMRDQLLRDADWAGMAHSLEIRTPLVDRKLIETLAPCIRVLESGEGKRALACAPSKPLPVAVTERAKTGFSVPTGSWISRMVDQQPSDPVSKGLVSRKWSRIVLDRAQCGCCCPKSPRAAA